MKNFIILVLTVSTTVALSSKVTRSRNIIVPAGQPEGRITRGHNATELQFPYQVGIIIQVTNVSRGFCGGSVLNNEWILTAAHCTHDAIKVTVLLGTIDITSPEVQHIVTNENIIVHGNYNEKPNENDISLIKIPFTTYTNKIQPVKLPNIGHSHYNYDRQYVIASGWGSVSDEHIKGSEMLQWTILQTMPNKICDQFFTEPILSTHICTANLAGANICNGDSGGPLVLKSDKTLIGIISFSSEKCLAGFPAAYTRVSSYLEWIKDFTGGWYEI